MQTEILLSGPGTAYEFSAAQILFTAGPTELSHQIEAKEVLNIIDVRAAHDFAEGHIPGAHNLPRDRWSDASVLRRDTVNILYSHSTDPCLTATAVDEFSRNGFPVMEMEGGFEAWKQNNLPVER